MANGESQVARAASRLIEAAESHRPCRPVRELFDDQSIDDAYAVQRLVTDKWKGDLGRRVGRKIGLTSPAVQRQMGVDQPDFGVLFAGMAYGDTQPVPSARLIQPRIEAEVAFVLGGDLSAQPIIATDVLKATEFVVASIEIVDSRIADWDISIVDTIADNASSGLFVTGGCPRSLTEIPDLRDCVMVLTCDGQVLSSGSGAACLGHPVNAVAWLANAVASRGDPLLAGEVVLSGALGPLVRAEGGKTYEAVIEGLGSVRAVVDC
jgi:2-keto-4-pentenoate hydratase